MKCYACGGNYIEHTGSLELPSKILGDFTIDNVPYLKCDHCEEIMLPDNTWQTADQEENRLIKDFLTNLPLKKYISASSAASILEMSRQALHKHRRIRRGFIYTILHEGKIYYHNDSVLLFKETGDGRFPLKKQVPQREKEYIVVTIPYSSEGNRFLGFGGEKKITGWNPRQNTLPTLTGHSYVQ